MRLEICIVFILNCDKKRIIYEKSRNTEYFVCCNWYSVALNKHHKNIHFSTREAVIESNGTDLPVR